MRACIRAIDVGRARRLGGIGAAEIKVPPIFITLSLTRRLARRSRTRCAANLITVRSSRNASKVLTYLAGMLSVEKLRDAAPAAPVCTCAPRKCVCVCVFVCERWLRAA